MIGVQNNRLMMWFAFEDIILTDFGAKCENCGTINKITLEKGELKKQV
jgi:hypothetical protein